MSEIGFRDIVKSYGAVKVFDGISFACPAQRYLCLLGPSGCGKTTLLRMVAGLVQPDRGDILINGCRVNDLPPSQRDIGLAFQNYALYPHLDVAGNLAFPLKAPGRRSKYSKADIEERIRMIARLLQIEPLLGRAVNQLSGGQQQRVALGRSVIAEPRVLLLDEPIAHLDARLRYETRAELKQLHRRIGTTTVHVTHDQQEALAIADVIAVIKDGALQQLGAPLDLYNNPRNAFVASFIGDPPMSLLQATVATDGGMPALRVGGRLLKPPPAMVADIASARTQSLLVGLRPAQIKLAGPGEPEALDATVYSHESIGREVELMLSVGESRLRYRSAPTGRKVLVGETLSVGLSLAGARLFEGTTGAALS